MVTGLLVVLVLQSKRKVLSRPVDDQTPKVIGSIRWEATHLKTERVTKGGKPRLYLWDVSEHASSKSIPLGKNFILLVSSIHPSHGKRTVFLDVLRTKNVGFADPFMIAQFTVDHPGHAIRPGTEQELEVKFAKTSKGDEVTRMEFVTDVTIDVPTPTAHDITKPGWVVKILHGSIVNWPRFEKGNAIPTN